MYDDAVQTYQGQKIRNGHERIHAVGNVPHNSEIGDAADENGNDVEFLLLDVVEYNNDDYMVMIPLDDEEIEDDDEQDGDADANQTSETAAAPASR